MRSAHWCERAFLFGEGRVKLVKLSAKLVNSSSNLVIWDTNLVKIEANLVKVTFCGNIWPLGNICVGNA